ncbi:odorant receptor 131-2-like [Solea senegalensis]|uniref:Odorant receptor 131-2-like n=1 Tax=Solea senegalensis TaxID=28829 RepID=A0AAV6QXT5_SOLSE|nr:olfactory receptor 11A1 [Solea senegalensis]KAG7496872.1 odorant receptor 131-2-like [Solea senegalensis]
MPSNNSTVPDPAQEYTCVRFYVSTASFSLLLFFNLIINWTIVREERLRTRVRYVLIFHLLVSALVYLGMSSVFYYQIHLDARPGRGACLLMVTVLITSASNALLTLTVMALDRYCAVCYPMRYSVTCTAGHWPWLLGLFTWLLALVIPLSLLLQLRGEDGYPHYDEKCGPEQLRVGRLHKVVFIGLCTVLILYTYVRILIEGRRLGVLNRRNRAGCRTIALHGSQLAVYILPNFVNFILSSLKKHGLINTPTKELSAVVIFAFFSLAQCIAPIVYGLRKEELMDQLSHRFPCCSRYLKSVLGWTLRASWPQHSQHRTRERTLTTLTILSQDVPQVPVEDEETRPVSDSSFTHDSHSCQGDTDNA